MEVRKERKYGIDELTLVRNCLCEPISDDVSV